MHAQIPTRLIPQAPRHLPPVEPELRPRGGRALLLALGLSMSACGSETICSPGRPLNDVTVRITEVAENPRLTYALDVYAYTDEAEPEVHAQLTIFDSDADPRTVLRLEATRPSGSFPGWWEAFEQLPSHAGSEAQACVFDAKDQRACVAPRVAVDRMSEGFELGSYDVATFDAESDAAAAPSLAIVKEILRYVWEQGQVPGWFHATIERDAIAYPL